MAGRRWAAWVLLGASAAGAAGVWAQEPGPVADAGKPMTTLHVYMDLIQVPVLVLDGDKERMKPIAEDRFLVSLDAGPVFHPKHVRQEGDDPVTLGILLDPNSEPELMTQMAAAVAGLAPGSLHAADHVSIYVMDCGLRRSLRDVPASAEALKHGVDEALKDWTARRKAKAPAPCAKRAGLWDVLATVVTDLSEKPGRRVLLAVTSGLDAGSTATWNQVRSVAQWKSVAIFGYVQPKANLSERTSDLLGASPLTRSNSRAAMGRGSDADTRAAEDPFGLVCEYSGGLEMKADANFVAKQLTRFTAMVRERYIVEFARARNDAPGEHNIDVTLVKASPRVYIRPAGVTTVVRDESGEGDPLVIPRDKTDAPELGTRKVLAKPD